MNDEQWKPEDTVFWRNVAGQCAKAGNDVRVPTGRMIDLLNAYDAWREEIERLKQAVAGTQMLALEIDNDVDERDAEIERLKGERRRLFIAEAQVVRFKAERRQLLHLANNEYTRAHDKVASFKALLTGDAEAGTAAELDDGTCTCMFPTFGTSATHCMKCGKETAR